ncbi:hypothetical protein CAE01nite_26810 [Cellulomonas aerilata]|uniref:TIR domain-containing protein n=2 Tax=Cellulomonas aerilata TaxID=515326 RepID=A0A512DEU1_9CELL|nr:hypothetical protein CAE01nite_26810 [Cellulomonas aerilata]
MGSKKRAGDKPYRENWVGAAFHPTDPYLALALDSAPGAITVGEYELDRVDAGPIAERYTTAKVVLLGDSGVGKTGLGYRMARGEFKEHSSTHGQQFWIIESLGRTRADGTKCDAVLWDLAGQPDYRLVHMLFLEDATAALIVVDATRRIESMKAISYWMKALSHSSGVVSVLLVAARVDVGRPILTAAEVEDYGREQGVNGRYLQTSAFTGEGVESLLETLDGAIDWDALDAVVTTKTLKLIRDAVLMSKEEGSEGESPLLTFEQLRNTSLKDLEVTDAELRSAVRNLERSGLIAVVQATSGVEAVVLKPELLNNLAASIILTARRNERGLGAVEEDLLRENHWSFSELQDMSRDEQFLMVDAAIARFLHLNVCFRTTIGATSLLVFPDLINERADRFAPSLELEESLTMVVDGKTEHVWAALVVLLGYTNVLRRVDQWQDRAVYGMDHAVLALTRYQRPDGSLWLTLHNAPGAPLSAKAVFRGLVEQFLARQRVSVRIYPIVACGQCGYRLDAAQVVTFVDSGAGVTFCPRDGFRIPLPTTAADLGMGDSYTHTATEQAGVATGRTALNVALSGLRTHLGELGRSTEKKSCFISYAWGVPAHEEWVRSTLVRDLREADIEVTLDISDSTPGASLARYISRISEADHVVVVGTRLYRTKYENTVADRGTAVAAEVDLIHLRMLGTEAEKRTVIPVLLEGSSSDAFPPLMRGRVSIDFTGGQYFLHVFQLIVSLWGLPADSEAVRRLSEGLVQFS